MEKFGIPGRNKGKDTGKDKDIDMADCLHHLLDHLPGKKRLGHGKAGAKGGLLFQTADLQARLGRTKTERGADGKIRLFPDRPAGQVDAPVQTGKHTNKALGPQVKDTGNAGLIGAGGRITADGKHCLNPQQMGLHHPGLEPEGIEITAGLVDNGLHSALPADTGGHSQVACPENGKRALAKGDGIHPGPG